jgi:hypothetical protein
VRGAAELPQPDAAGSGRWAATIARVQQEDDAEAARILARLEQALLVGASVVDGRLGIAVMKRFPGPAYTSSIPIEVREGDRLVCELSALVQEWRSIEDQLKEAIEADRATRVGRWMVRRRISEGVYVGGVAVPVDGCPEAVGPAAVVGVRGIRDEVLAYPAKDLARTRRSVQERAKFGARGEAASTSRSEAQWRSAFAKLRAELARLQERRRAYRDALDRQSDSATIERARRELPSLEREIERAREALDDLDRRASNESIPQEWRR